MLVLSRKVSEEIVIPELDITIMVVEVRGDKVRIGVRCDKKFAVHRKEVWEAIQAEGQKSESPPLEPSSAPEPVSALDSAQATEGVSSHG